MNIKNTSSKNNYLEFFKSKLILRNYLEKYRGNELRFAAIKGTLISLAGFGSQKLIQLASSLILTRLLFPEAFGLMTLATVFLTGIGMLSDFGIKQSIIQNSDGTDTDFLNTAWTMSVIRGLLIAGFICLIAYPVSLLYQQPLLFPLLGFLSLNAVFQGFNSVAIATQSRDLKFVRVVGIELFTAVISVVVTVSCALVWSSVWTLAIGSLAGSLFQMTMSHFILPCHKLRLTIDTRHMCSILHYGKWILFATLVSFIAIHGLPLIQGWFVSAEVLGLISIATTLAIAPRELLIKIIGSVAFPVFARIVRESPGQLCAVVGKTRTITNSVGIILFITLSVVAEPLISIMYDSRYHEAGLYLSILAVNGAIGFLPDLYQNVQLARGKSNLHFYVMLSAAIFRSLGMIVGFNMGGVIGMLLGLCCGSLVTYCVSALLAYKAKFLCGYTDIVSIGVIVSYLALKF